MARFLLARQLRLSAWPIVQAQCPYFASRRKGSCPFSLACLYAETKAMCLNPRSPDGMCAGWIRDVTRTQPDEAAGPHTLHTFRTVGAAAARRQGTALCLHRGSACAAGEGEAWWVWAQPVGLLGQARWQGRAGVGGCCCGRGQVASHRCCVQCEHVWKQRGSAGLRASMSVTFKCQPPSLGPVGQRYGVGQIFLRTICFLTAHLRAQFFLSFFPVGQVWGARFSDSCTLLLLPACLLLPAGNPTTRATGTSRAAWPSAPMRARHCAVTRVGA